MLVRRTGPTMGLLDVALDDLKLPFDGGFTNQRTSGTQKHRSLTVYGAFLGSGGWIRTSDLQVMSLTSCHRSTSRRLVGQTSFLSVEWIHCRRGIFHLALARPHIQCMLCPLQRSLLLEITAWTRIKHVAKVLA